MKIVNLVAIKYFNVLCYCIFIYGVVYFCTFNFFLYMRCSWDNYFTSLRNIIWEEGVQYAIILYTYSVLGKVLAREKITLLFFSFRFQFFYLSLYFIILLQFPAHCFYYVHFYLLINAVIICFCTFIWYSFPIIVFYIYAFLFYFCTCHLLFGDKICLHFE